MLMRRRANVESAAMLRPHDHAVWFGDGSAALYATASEALAEGVRRNEKLMFVAKDPDASLLEGLDALQLIEDRQLEVVDVEAVYGGGTDFSASAQLATFQRVLDDALADGYSGIRVVADNTSLAQGDDESFARWLAWEQLTDHFQAGSLVTGICFFDASAISAERLADLAALHPMRMAAGPVEPGFTIFVDRDAVLVIGSLSFDSRDQLRRLLAAIDFEQKPVVDLSATQLVDNQVLLALAALASAERPLVLRGNDHLRARVDSLGPAGAHLRVEQPQAPAYRCAGCGDVIGVYERASILLADATHSTSPLAEPEVVNRAAARFHSECYAAA
jgi:MEDS: MEthanogen/methylotroph, DcmR Sensory domain